MITIESCISLQGRPFSIIRREHQVVVCAEIALRVIEGGQQAVGIGGGCKNEITLFSLRLYLLAYCLTCAPPPISPPHCFTPSVYDEIAVWTLAHCC